ncbi:chemotaxis protein CheW [Anoxynatronum buryatiense]|uniref:Chemotaxis protein CheA n=1 Tax=Anoxynatronum buryatiense TaxID=489973 RepID=A0AA45WUH1_9CLOT|nr:chemotaxis protein CheW [Anoxynatronum buryatiense]SMP48028.1 two-component system, chemotaxis family, sensor kinase CheA [Anoxynatronum buryatiense]
MIQNEEFINEFVEEAKSHLDMIEAGLLSMEEGCGDSENINTIFRSIHSIKGTAGFFGLEKIVELAHVMENLLGEIRNQKIAPDSVMIDHLLRGNDQLKTMVDNVTDSNDVDVTNYVAIFTDLLNQETAPETAKKLILSSAETNHKIMEIDQHQENQIKKARQHGHHLYKVTIAMNRDLGSEISPIKFFKKIQSVGEIVDSFIDISDIDGLDSVMEADVVFAFVFTTVLEKNLLPIALDIQDESIEELDTETDLSTLNLSNEASIKKAKLSKLTENQTPEIIFNENENKETQSQNGTETISVVADGLSVVGRKESGSTAEDSVRVHVSLLNDLLNLASEMVLGRNQLLRNIDQHRKQINGLDSILQNIDRVTTELQEKIMQTRMQPVGNVFNKMPRVIRDLSKKLGKEVDLIIEGSHVELDKSIIESLSDPLTHLIRNAADHGLEMPAERKKAGKPTKGTVLLKAYHESGYVHIDIVDDGAGIDADRIRKKGLEKGLVSESELKHMGEQEVLQILMKPGFSTAEKITDVSGRGVGMDVVKTNIEKLGGTVEIQTKLGEGTTFRMILPLTLAIIPSLIVEVNNYKFALPQVNLQEMVRIKAGDESKKIELVHRAQVLRLRGKLLPIVHLGEVLGLDQRQTDSEGTAADITRVLVLKAGSKRFGLIVDRIFDEEEILVKPLPKYFKNCQGYSGVTIMGDGKTAMILDPEGIVTKASLRFTEDQIETTQLEQQEQTEELREAQNLLMFKCSGEETFAIDLSLVSRVEEILPSQIEIIGDKEYIKHRGEALRVIRPEQYLPVTSKQNNPEKLYVIIPKLVANPIGLIIEKIHDTMMTSIKLNQEDIKGKGIIGSTILNDKIVLLVNIYEIFEMVSPDEYENKSLKNSAEGAVILLAEDTPFFSRMTKNYLEWAGYQVYAVENGKTALELLKEKAVDLVLSDIQMPVMDGLELAREIRKDPDLAALPMVALTSMTGALDRQAGFEAGFDFYEFKLDKVTILETLKKALHLRGKAV